jgi:hypothetical protein
MCKVCERRTNTKSIKQYAEWNKMLSKERSAEYDEDILIWMFKRNLTHICKPF